MGASIGRAAKFDIDVRANINQAVALVRIQEASINPEYLLQYLNSEKALQMYDSMKSDVTEHQRQCDKRAASPALYDTLENHRNPLSARDRDTLREVFLLRQECLTHVSDGQGSARVSSLFSNLF